MKFQVCKLAGLALCASSMLWTAQAAPESTQVKKEQGVSASRLRVGDVIYAIHAGKHEFVFDGSATAKVVSLSPLTLNLDGTTQKAFSNDKKMPMGTFAVLSGTGRRSGTIAVITVTKPNNLGNFTRLTN